jgi:hypothetical protein
MTKFVLHGGFNKEIGFIKDGFFQEMLKDVPQDTKVLLVYFAESEEMKPIRTEQGINQFEKNRDLRNIEIKITSPDTFIEDCKWADVIFFSGGRTMRLMEVLKKYKGLDEIFKGKTIGGDSAGANFLGLYFYSKGSQEVGKGLGILPVKIFVHYKDDIPNPLAEIEPDLETVFLREYEIKVFHK